MISAVNKTYKGSGGCLSANPAGFLNMNAAGSGKPPWLKIRPPTTEKFNTIKQKLRKIKLRTVCEEAHCPNLSECWSGGTATFMLMGDTCTRGCRFCAVKTGNPHGWLDEKEPEKLAEAISTFGLDYAVITSVARDDLPDGGAEHLSKCIIEVREKCPEVLIEILIPDFRGHLDALRKIVDARPNVIAHNVETVERLTKYVRDGRAKYRQSLEVLANIKKLDPTIYSKSGIMLGLGETEEEVAQTMKDLRAIDVDIFTMGQYLRPSAAHIAVKKYVPPDIFEKYKKIGEELGFLYVASGPFVRSSYKAGKAKLSAINKK